MKLRYYLRGLGIGLIVTTLILTISNNLRNSAHAEANEHKEATGSVLAYTTQAATENATKAENSETTASDQETTDETKQSEQEQQTEAVTKKQTEETTTAAATDKKGSASSDDDNSDVIKVTIKDVYYSSIATDILYKKGIITDKSEFNAYMNSSGYATKIKDGEYSLKKGDTYENIAKTITKTK